MLRRLEMAALGGLRIQRKDAETQRRMEARRLCVFAVLSLNFIAFCEDFVSREGREGCEGQKRKCFTFALFASFARHRLVAALPRCASALNHSTTPTRKKRCGEALVLLVIETVVPFAVKSPRKVHSGSFKSSLYSTR